MQSTRVLIGCLILLMACYSNAVEVKTEDENCSGKTCRLSGQLDILPGGLGAASIKTVNGCFDLALPKNILDAAESWNGRMVKIIGEPVSRPNTPSAAWYDIKDRRVEPGGCGSSTVYVNSITRQ
jgi:hypothetical protein